MRKDLPRQEVAVRNWITRNRGVLTRIAVQHRVVPQFVQMMAYGRSSALPGHPVERALRASGWPGIKRADGKK